jgi:hypothetical protein
MRPMARRHRGPALAVTALLAALPGRAMARTTRPLFEPTDLELEEAGVAEMDLQVGAIRGPGPWRVVLPDFELDVGILPWLEIDLDGAYAIEGPATGPFSFDHAAPDSLWPCVKLGLFDSHDPTKNRSMAFGVQVGPKIPTAPGAHGVGMEGLALLGVMVRRLQTVVNAGAFADPAPSADEGRPVGIELGVDLGLGLDAAEHFSLTSELAGVWFASHDPRQLLATSGLTWSVTDNLDLSLSALVGIFAGSDRYGVLVGMSPKMRLFGRAVAP